MAEEIRKETQEEQPDLEQSCPEADASCEENTQETEQQEEQPGEQQEEESCGGEAEQAEDDVVDGEFVQAQEGSKKSSFFKKKKDKRDEKIEELVDRVQRQMAEFDNFRKRSEKEKSQMFDMGARSVIEKILPVIDNFERGLETGDASDPFVDGMNKIYKQMVTMLTELGVTPIEAVGKPFDPNLHNAV
ncbi:MAG: nucleotide exchange factor GrpE, partial [Lachnospiraceae bacterium]|nr:nucleotide exchange factor GrpE [Lachnospiraceae bacterium]